MKKALLVTLALVTTTAFAAPGMGPGHRGDPEHRLDRMAQALELTDTQRDEVGAIFKEQREKMMALHEETQERISTVLTPEQREKAEALREERKEKMGKRMERMQKRMEQKNAE